MVSTVPAHTSAKLGDFVIVGAIGSGTTVTSTGVVATDSHDTPPTVEIVILLNHVVCVNAPDVYVDPAGPTIGPNPAKALVVLLSQR
jgi:hypothetical protein